MIRFNQQVGRGAVLYRQEALDVNRILPAGKRTQPGVKRMGHRDSRGRAVPVGISDEQFGRRDAGVGQ